MFLIFLNIIRWKELLYLTFILFLFKFSFLHGYGFTTTLSFIDLGILVISGWLILASGSLINYYYKKQKKSSKQLSLQKAKNYSILFGLIGIFIGAFLSFKIQKPSYSLVFVICAFVVFIYSKNVKEKTFIINIVKSFLQAFVILFVCWFDSPTKLSLVQWDLLFKLEAIVIFYISISFLSNIARGIISDLNNIDEDNSNNHKTLPILLGRKKARSIALYIAIVVCLIVLSVAVCFIDTTYIFITIISLGTIPQLILIYFLMIASTTSDYKFLHKISNIAFLIGIISIPVITYYLKYVVN